VVVDEPQFIEEPAINELFIQEEPVAEDYCIDLFIESYR